MSEGNAAVEVTQGDREEFAKLCDIHGGPNVMPSYVRMGQADDHPGVQAFVRHRLSATTSDETARLRESLEAIRDHATARIQDGIELGATVWRLALEDIVRDVTAALQSQEIQS